MVLFDEIRTNRNMFKSLYLKAAACHIEHWGSFQADGDTAGVVLEPALGKVDNASASMDKEDADGGS